MPLSSFWDFDRGPHTVQIYMGVAADCEYVNHYGSQSNATQQILTIWNTASVLYKVRERAFSFAPSSSPHGD